MSGFDGIWRLADPPMSGEQVRRIQDRALRHFSSYAIPLGVTRNGLYDGPTSGWVAEYQIRKNDAGYTPRLPANPSAKTGDCDYATKVALGILPGSVVNPPAKVPGAVAYSVPGTWAAWNDGPPWWVCERLDPGRFYSQGVGYPAMGFLQPDPNTSYIESRDAGVAELLRLTLPDPRPKIPIGYSQGADVVVRWLYAWPVERRDEVRAVITFGSPGRPPGFDESGSTSGHGGISRVYTPQWAAAREYSYCIEGDMYADAPGLLPFFYEVLTRLELSGEFVFYLFSLLTGVPTAGGFGSPQGAPSNIGAQLLGLGGPQIPGWGGMSGLLGLITPGPVSVLAGPVSLAAMLLNVPAIIQTLLAAARFVFTKAHSRYGGSESLPIFGGTDAVIHAAAVVNGLRI